MGATDLTLAGFALAVLGLLFTPGPTNTLLAVGGALRFRQGVTRLVPAEMAGYLLAVVPIWLLGEGLIRAIPDLAIVLQGVAGLWVGWLALHLSRQRAVSDATAATVTPGRVFVTTLFNPKALVFGLVLLPQLPGNRWQGLAVLALAILAVGTFWTGLGAVIGRQPLAIVLLHRAAAVWLATLALILLVRSLGLL